MARHGAEFQPEGNVVLTMDILFRIIKNSRMIMRMHYRLILSLLAVLAFTTPAYATLHIDITRGNVEPMPIALPDLAGDPIGTEIMQVVSGDLERSGLFRPISPQSFIEQVTTQTVTPRF